MSRERRLALVSKDDPLSVARQRRLLGVCRRAAHRPAKAVSDGDLALMRRMDVRFCPDAPNEALSAHPAPGIFNTEQGSQFTSEAFTGAVQAAGAHLSMDGVGRWRDNVVIERLWRLLKVEAVYLYDLSDGLTAHDLMDDWMRFYNEARPHSALGGRTPCMAYEGRPLPLARAPEGLALFKQCLEQDLVRELGLLPPKGSANGQGEGQ